MSVPLSQQTTELQETQQKGQTVPSASEKPVGAICTHCSAPIEEDTLYCPECGTPTTGETHTCHVCGEITDGAYCNSCGAALLPTECPDCGQPSYFAYCESCGAQVVGEKIKEDQAVLITDRTSEGKSIIFELDQHFSTEERTIREKLEHRAIVLKEKGYFEERELRIAQWKAGGNAHFSGPSADDLALAKMMSTNLIEFRRQWQSRKDEEERLAQTKAEEERAKHEELVRLRRAAEEAERCKKEAEEAARRLQADKAARESADREAALREAQEKELKLRQEAAEAQKRAQAAAIQQRKEAESRVREVAKKQRQGFSGRWSGANNSTGHYECLEINVGDTSFSANLFSSSAGVKSVEYFKGSINPPNIQLTCYKYDVLYCPSNAIFSFGHFSGRLSNDLRTLTGVWTYPVTGRRSQVVLTRSG